MGNPASTAYDRWCPSDPPLWNANLNHSSLQIITSSTATSSRNFLVPRIATVWSCKYARAGASGARGRCDMLVETN